MLFFAVCALVLLSMGAAWFLDRMNNRRLETERRLAEREQENRRWQTVGEMAATVAHEVRNPLNTVQMVAQRLRLEFEVQPQSRDEYGELVSLLQSESERVNRVVGDFLELGRPVRLQPGKELLPEVMERSLAPLRLRAEKEGKHLQMEPVPEEDAWLDGRRFVQIVSNLAGNALDAVGPGGSVRLSARLDAGTLRVEIADDGPGMDEQTLQQAQRPFFTTKSSGTGLGLPLARRLVEAHDGVLELSSSPGRGTRVRIALPAKMKTG
jgi:two-component system sensor histidine kinase HydH